MLGESSRRPVALEYRILNLALGSSGLCDMSFESRDGFEAGR